MSKSALSSPEFRVCIIVWAGSLAYSFYSLYKNAKVNFSQNDFTSSRFWFTSNLRDNTDYEWNHIITFFIQAVPWLFGHLFLNQLVRKFCPRFVPLSYTVVTFTFYLSFFPTFLISSYCFLGIVFFVLSLVKSQILIWIGGIVILCIININTHHYYFYVDDYYGHIYFISVCWHLLRCLDFSLYKVHLKKSDSESFFDMMGYLFYFPCFTMGPFISYKDFRENFRSPYTVWSEKRIMNLILKLSKYIFCFFFVELSLHYFHCSAMIENIKEIVPLGLWTLNGVGICLGKFFYLKYVAVYGFNGALAAAELYSVPSQPVCISRIHLYSRMWRRFDRGFYIFIYNRIYKPICGSTHPKVYNKLFASLVCFIFVWIWHGISQTIFYWSLLNFIGITIEGVGSNLRTHSWIQVLEYQVLGPKNFQRFCSLLAAPLWILALISNYIFFGGEDFGFVYYEQLWKASWQSLTVIMFVSYCMCQVSYQIEKWELDKKLESER